MFGPLRGVAIYWLALHAAFLTGAAALSLLNSSGVRHRGWLAAFAAFAALAALSRYVAGLYVLLMGAPVLIVYLFRRWRIERTWWRSVGQPTLLVTPIFGALADYFLIAHFSANIDFYTTYSYAIGNSRTAAAIWYFKSLDDFIDSRIGLTVLVGVFVCGLGLAYASRRFKIHNLAAGSPATGEGRTSRSTQVARGRVGWLTKARCCG